MATVRLLVGWIVAGVILAAFPALAQRFEPDIRLEDLPKIEPPKEAPTFSVPEAPERPAPPGASSVRFVLSGVEILGATVYTAETLKPYYATLIGKEISLADIYQAARDIQRLYRTDGYFLTRVIVPRQTIRQGTVALQVIEGFIDSVRIEGDPGSVVDLIESYLARIVNERPARLETVERALLLANDIPGVTVSSLLRPSPETFGAAELIATASRTPFNAFSVVDNYGDEFNGTWEGAIGAASNAFTPLGEEISAIAFTSDPFNGFRQKVGQFSTSWRLGDDGVYVNTLASYGDSNPGDEVSSLDIESKTLLVDVNVGYPVIRSRTLSVYAELGFDFLNTDTDVFKSIPITRDRTRALYVTGRTTWRDAWLGATSAELNFSQGLPIFDATTSSNDTKSRPDGTSLAPILSGTVSRTQGLISGFALFTKVGGQVAFDDTLSDTEFEIGGTQYGRGYDQKELSGDNGMGVTTELQYTPRLDLPILDQVQIFAFHDYGMVRDRGGDRDSNSLSSAGGGVRFGVLNSLTFELQAAKPLTKRSLRANGGRSTQILFRAVGRI